LSGGLGGAGGVVRHVVDADRALVQPADAVDGPVDRSGAVVDDAVEVEQDAVDRPALGRGLVLAVHLLDDGAHWSPSASASARISSSSASISSSVTLTDFSSFAEMCVVGVLAAAAVSGSGSGSLFASGAMLGEASAASGSSSTSSTVSLSTPALRSGTSSPNSVPVALAVRRESSSYLSASSVSPWSLSTSADAAMRRTRAPLGFCVQVSASMM